MRQELRPYQQEGLEALCAAIRSGPGNYLLHLGEGGGKTWVAADLAEKVFQQPGWQTLWISKDWNLLRQASEVLRQRHPTLYQNLVRLGGESGCLCPELPERSGAIILTTLQTFYSRLAKDALPSWVVPNVVVWDECHWGQRAVMGRTLLSWTKAHDCRVVGLTATPLRHELSQFKIVHSSTFVDLVEAGHLAAPEIMAEISTGVDWAPEMSGRTGDVRRESLKVLATNSERNRLIVKTYVEGQATWGKTLVFACNIAHADLLAQQLTAAGVPARPVHSQRGRARNDEYLAQFERGEIQVLVSVEKLSHGVDIPSLLTVFLCRPTFSEILYSQMVGRGSRLHIESGKKRYYVMEFTDNLLRFGDLLRTARNQFASAYRAPSKRTAVKSSDIRPTGHWFDPEGAPTWIPDQPSVPEEIRGLWYRENQTFGLEFEVTCDGFPGPTTARWRAVADALRGALASILGADRVAQSITPSYHSRRVCNTWQVSWDNSCGWEIASPVLRNRTGFEETVKACKALAEVMSRENLKVNFRTATHLHLGWLGDDATHLRRAIFLVRAMEPGLGTLVAPSRLVRFDGRRYSPGTPNQYCKPISTMFPAAKLTEAETVDDIMDLAALCTERNLTFNLLPLRTIGTVEVRLHSGTTSASKILLWVSLCQQILWAAAKDQQIQRVPDVDLVVPDGDILNLMGQYLPDVQPDGFSKKVHQRRNEISGRWLQAPDLAHWVAYSTSWTPPSSQGRSSGNTPGEAPVSTRIEEDAA